MAMPVLSAAPSSIRNVHRIHLGDGALVTGADYRGLGIVRSLGRRGIPVWVLKQDEHLVGSVSRYTCRSLRYPLEDDRKQLDFLLDLAVREGLNGWVLFPTTDESVVLVARHHDLLAEHYRLTTPPWDALRWVFDKRLLHRLAQDLALDRPWTFCPRNREELASLECPFPVILKPAMRLGFNRLNCDKAWRIEDRASLLSRYDEACALVAPEMLMVQEVVPGWGEAQFSYAALCRDGRPWLPLWQGAPGSFRWISAGSVPTLSQLMSRKSLSLPFDYWRLSASLALSK